MNQKQQNQSQLDSQSTVVLGSGWVKPDFTASTRPRHSLHFKGSYLLLKYMEIGESSS